MARIEDGERQFHLLVGAVNDYAIYMLDTDGAVVTWNAGAERIKGYTAREIIGENFARFYTRADRQAGAPAQSLRTALQCGRFEAEAQRVRKDGSLFWACVVIHPVFDETGTHIGYAKITRDVTERHQSEERLRQLAHFDPLTQLPNRVTIQSVLDELVGNGEAVAALMLDLDDFKSTNDSLGHAAGDAILACAASRIRRCVGERGIVGRWASDEFVVVLRNEDDVFNARQVADELIAAFRPCFDWEACDVHLGLSIGVAIGSGSTAPEELLTNADLALCEAKAIGHNTCQLYEPRLRHELQSRKVLERELREAVDRGEFELFYQPQVRLSDGEIIGAEALLRWRHPRHGLLAPNAFIAALESSAFAYVVGDWAIREACAFARRVRQHGAADFRVAVNLFAAQFRRGQLVAIVREALRESKLPAGALELEITENIILGHDADMVEPLRELREMGVGIAFDDYGTGYASLSLLKRYPLTSLKIDQSFVRKLPANVEDKAVVRSILYLARNFGLGVVAEGIETDEHADFLRGMECSKGQGYLFGRPVPGERFMSLLGAESGADRQSA